MAPCGNCRQRDSIRREPAVDWRVGHRVDCAGASVLGDRPGPHVATCAHAGRIAGRADYRLGVLVVAAIGASLPRYVAVGCVADLRRIRICRTAAISDLCIAALALAHPP